MLIKQAVAVSNKPTDAAKNARASSNMTYLINKKAGRIPATKPLASCLCSFGGVKDTLEFAATQQPVFCTAAFREQYRGDGTRITASAAGRVGFQNTSQCHTVIFPQNQLHLADIFQQLLVVRGIGGALLQLLFIEQLDQLAVHAAQRLSLRDA